MDLIIFERKAFEVYATKQDIKGKKWYEQVFQLTVGYDLYQLL